MTATPPWRRTDRMAKGNTLPPSPGAPTNAPFLVKKDTLTSAELRGLAELVCEGQTLELADDTLLDSLRDSLRCAALAAREVSPENA